MAVSMLSADISNLIVIIKKMTFSLEFVKLAYNRNEIISDNFFQEYQIDCPTDRLLCSTNRFF
jgi:hypothetical protein